MKLEARVEGLYLGDKPGVEKRPVRELVVDFEGIFGDRHYGFTKPSDSRTPEYPRGTQIRNSRQWSAIASEEIEEIARRMHIDCIDPAWLGVNLFLRGIPDLSQLPKGTKLEFPRDTVLLVEDQNMPCTGPGEVIASKFPEGTVRPWHFPKAAMIDKTTSRRGLVGVVDRLGMIFLSDLVVIRPYQPRIHSLPPLSKQPSTPENNPSDGCNLLVANVTKLIREIPSCKAQQRWQSFTPEQKVKHLPTFIKMLAGVEDLSVSETAEILGVIPDRVRQICKKGRLRGKKNEKGWYFVGGSDLTEYQPRQTGRPKKPVKIVNILQRD